MNQETVLLAGIGGLWCIVQGATWWILTDIRERIVRLEDHVFSKAAS